MPTFKLGALIVLVGLLAMIVFSNLAARSQNAARASAAPASDGDARASATQEELQAAYQRGQLDAQLASNRATEGAFQKGRDAGDKDGYQKGYDEGYEAGQTEGRNEGAASGLQQGTIIGYAQGHEHGFAQGQLKGLEEGYQRGLQAGRDGQ